MGKGILMSKFPVSSAILAGSSDLILVLDVPFIKEMELTLIATRSKTTSRGTIGNVCRSPVYKEVSSPPNRMDPVVEPVSLR
jgi:hypothetical protein